MRTTFLLACLGAVAVSAVGFADSDQVAEPATVYLVLGGPDASGLYHRDSCPLIQKGGITASMELDDAKKRYFRPHCACIAGKEAEPPCTENTSQAASAATTSMDVSKYIGMETKDVVKLHGVPTTIIQDLWNFERVGTTGITLRVANNRVVEAWAGSRATAPAAAAPTPQNSPPDTGRTYRAVQGWHL